MDNIRMDLGEIGLSVIDWIVLDQDTDQCRSFMNAVVKFGFHKML
jgi:hypothetical protein